MEGTTPPNSMGMDYRSDSSSGSSIGHIHAPVPMRPRLPSRKSSGTMIVPRDSLEVGPIDMHAGPDDARAMSPRRTTEDIETLGKAARAELQRYVPVLRRGGVHLLTYYADTPKPSRTRW